MRKIKDVLKIVFLTLAILTMLVSLFGRGHAADMPQSGVSALNDFFDDFTNYNDFKNVLNQIYNDTSYFVLLKNPNSYSGTSFFTSDVNVMPMTITSYDSLSSPEGFSSSYNRTAFSMISNYPATGVIMYSIYFSGNRVYLIDKASVYESCSFTFSDNSPYFYGARSNISTVYGSRLGTMVNNVSPLYVLGELPKFNAYYARYDGTYTPNLFPVVVNPDISVYKSLDNNGLPVLNVSWSKTPLPGTGGYNYAGYTNVDIKFDIDGSERVVSINSDDYPELFSNYADGKFYIPWSVFQKVALLVTDYDTVTSVSVTQVDVSMKGYPQGATVESAQTYTMNTLVSPALVFKGQDSSIPSFDDDTIAKENPEDVSINVTEYNQYITGVLNSYHNQDNTWNLTSSFSNDANSEVLYLNAYSWSNNLSSPVIRDEFGFEWDTSRHESFLQYFYDNAFTLNYDIVRFSVYVNRSSTSDSVSDYSFEGYIVFYTNRYYLRLLNTQAVNISDLMRVSNNYLYGTYDFLYTRMNNMNGNMVSFFESSLNKQNSVLSYLGSVNSGLNNLNSNFVNLTSSTHGYLNNILTAIDNIDVPDPADLSGVLSKMDVLGDNIADLPNAVRSDLIYLFMPSYDDIDVSYNQYKENIGILALPFDTCKLVLDTVDDNYSQNLSIDLPKIEFLQYKLYDGMHYELNPWVFFDDTKLSENDNPTGQGFVMGLRYFIAFSAIYGAVLSTYLHIFRRVESN